MANRIINLNPAQFNSVILNAKNKVDIWGRGTGKSYLVGWDIDLINKLMPRAVTSITGQTYGQLLTRTLPSTLRAVSGSSANISVLTPKTLPL